MLSEKYTALNNKSLLSYKANVQMIESTGLHIDQGKSRYLFLGYILTKGPVDRIQDWSGHFSFLLKSQS